MNRRQTVKGFILLSQERDVQELCGLNRDVPPMARPGTHNSTIPIHPPRHLFFGLYSGSRHILCSGCAPLAPVESRANGTRRATVPAPALLHCSYKSARHSVRARQIQDRLLTVPGWSRWSLHDHGPDEDPDAGLHALRHTLSEAGAYTAPFTLQYVAGQDNIKTAMRYYTRVSLRSTSCWRDWRTCGGRRSALCARSRCPHRTNLLSS